MNRKRPKTSLKYTLAPGNNFGKDAPRFTIPSSRKEEPPPYPYPGPGEYEIKNIEHYRKLQPTFPKSRPQTVQVSETANVEFINYRSFPEIKGAHIFNREKIDFYDMIESPAPNYVPIEKVTQIPHQISPKVYDRSYEKTAHLGPGSYNLKFPDLPREPSFNFYGPKKRDSWILETRDIPGPGQYQPSFVQKRQPVWTIGRKSRLSRRTRSSLTNAQKKDIIAIDQVIIRLDELSNPAAARQYIMTHQILRDVVHEIIQTVLNEKPDDPVSFLEAYFSNVKSFMTPKNQET